MRTIPCGRRSHRRAVRHWRVLTLELPKTDTTASEGRKIEIQQLRELSVGRPCCSARFITGCASWGNKVVENTGARGTSGRARSLSGRELRRESNGLLIPLVTGSNPVRRVRWRTVCKQEAPLLRRS